MKKAVKISGKLLFPLREGQRAVILRGSEYIYTSCVVKIIEQSTERACFETMNSIYCVSRYPVPEKASVPYFLALCA